MNGTPALATACLGWVLLTNVCFAHDRDSTVATMAESILGETGIEGGLIVH